MLNIISLLTTVFLLIPTNLPLVTDLELRDQHGHSDRLSSHRNQNVMVMLVTVRRLPTLKPWEKHLRERFDDLQFLRIADVPDSYPVNIDQIAEKLRERAPQQIAILIDKERRWAKALALDTSEPQLLLFDKAGKLLGHFQGRWTLAQLEAITPQIKKLLQAQPPSP